MQVRKILKYVIYILIFIVINLILFSNKVEAVEQRTTTNINGIDSNKYPGVKQMIQTLQIQHPSWTFKVLYTGLDFSEVIANEYIGHFDSPRSMISGNLTGEWKCPICGDTRYDNGSWACASEIAIKYMVDPRNSINNSDVFQFIELTYTDCTYDSIQKMVAGTFLNNASYINTIINTAINNNVNAYYIAALALQEQGPNGGGTVSGQYPGYEGYYNIFNIGASGSGADNIIRAGLQRAQTEGWTSIEKSIEGGVAIIKTKYIARGQNTIYLKKFDVDYSDGSLYWHQYQQNILAAQSEGEKIRDALRKVNAIDAPYTFIIPLYENTPSVICRKPNTTDGESTIESDIVIVNVNNTLTIRTSPNGSTLSGIVLYSGEIVTRLNKATTKVGGTYWDYILKSDGTRGYVARETKDSESPYKLYLVPYQPPTVGQPEENDPNRVKVKLEEETNTVIAVPGATVQDVIDLLGEATVKNKEGVEVSGKLATGYTVNGTSVVVLGDVNGDGEATALDAAIILRYTVNLYTMTDIQLKAGLIGGAGLPTALDAAKILRYSVGQFKIDIQ